MKRAIVLALSGWLLIGCGSSDGAETSTDSTATVASTDPGRTDDTVGESETHFDATLGDPVDGWQEPVDIAVRNTPGDGPVTHLVERTGVISILNSDGTRGDVVLDMSDLTRADGERGLLGLAFSLDGRAFVDYTDLDGNTNVDQYLLNDDGTFDESSRTRIFFLAQPYPNHNGGEILMIDDSLYVFTGDGGSANDPDRVALDPESQLGKIIRLVETDGKWSAGEVVASGLRNPWRASVDPVTATLWIADVGQDTFEEINAVNLGTLEGSSFGWSYLEATTVFNDDQKAANDRATNVAPVFEYQHANGRCSISGGAVYRGAGIPVEGTWYVWADWCTGEVIATCFRDGPVCGEIALGTTKNPVGVLTDGAGELWVLNQGGNIVPIIAA